MSWDDLGLLLRLSPGELIEATDDSTGQRWQGTVDVVAPKQGRLWMYTDLGERKLFDADMHTISQGPVQPS